MGPERPSLIVGKPSWVKGQVAATPAPPCPAVVHCSHRVYPQGSLLCYALCGRPLPGNAPLRRRSWPCVGENTARTAHGPCVRRVFPGGSGPLRLCVAAAQQNTALFSPPLIFLGISYRLRPPASPRACAARPTWLLLPTIACSAAAPPSGSAPTAAAAVGGTCGGPR